jgi:hypothetical protein
LCASQLTITDMGGMSLNLACNYTVKRSSQPYQVSRTADFSYLLVSSILFSASSPSSPLRVHNFTTITEHEVKSFLHISPCHDHELTLSTAYTQYSIHQAQYTPSTASTQERLSSHYFHDYELTPECSFSFRNASLHD